MKITWLILSSILLLIWQGTSVRPMSSASNGESHSSEADMKYPPQRALATRLSMQPLQALSRQLTKKLSSLSKMRLPGMNSPPKLSPNNSGTRVSPSSSVPRADPLRTDSLKQKGIVRWASRDIFAIRRMSKVWAAVQENPCRDYGRNPEWRRDKRYRKAVHFKNLYYLRKSETKFTIKRRHPPDERCYDAVKELGALPQDLNSLCRDFIDAQCFALDWSGKHVCVMFKRVGKYYTPVRFSKCAKKATDEFLEKWKDSEQMGAISQWESQNNPDSGVGDGSMSESLHTWVDTEQMADTNQEELEEIPDPGVEDSSLPESLSESLRNSMSRSPMPRRSMTRSPMPQNFMPQNPMPRNPMNSFISRTGTYSTIESQYTGPQHYGPIARFKRQ